MPDECFDLKAVRARQAQARAEAARELPDESPTPAARAQAIAHCTLCDDDGYRAGSTVCDHIDRTETTRRGVAAVRAALERGGA